MQGACDNFSSHGLEFAAVKMAIFNFKQGLPKGSRKRIVLKAWPLSQHIVLIQGHTPLLFLYICLGKSSWFNSSILNL